MGGYHIRNDAGSEQYDGKPEKPVGTPLLDFADRTVFA